MLRISRIKWYILFLFLIVFWSFSCNDKHRFNDLIESLKNADTDHTFVVAHRGDWRNAPENSLQAIQNCMDKGVEMIEIDLQRTSDGVFILMHDASVDRTTTGKGKVSELSWKAIKQVYLRNGLGSWTTHKVPRLEEVLDITKGKILINLDKSYNHIDAIYKLLKARAMEEQVIFKGWMKPYDVVSNDLKVPLDSINFMPILDGKDKHWKTVLNSYSGKYVPMAIEIIFTTEALGKEMIRDVKKTGSRVWVNALWPDMNAGHDDEMALNHPDKVYGWFIKNGVSMIQTDRIDVLIEYLDTHR